MKEPLISVIIPVYKVEEFLEDCVNSVVGQTYKNLEIILVDDGSPDQCPAMCDAWAERDSRVRVIHKENGGLSDARNAGLEAASGELISFLDSDDIVEREMLSKLLEAMGENDDIVECDYVKFTDEIPANKEVLNPDPQRYTPEEAMEQLLREQEFRYVAWNKLYRRHIFEDLRFEKGKLHEDVFFTYLAFGKAASVVKINLPLCFYRQREGSIMGTKFSMRNLASLEARKRQYLYVKEKFPKLAALAQNQALGNCLYFGQLALRSKDQSLTEQVFQVIKPIFAEIYGAQRVETSGKQKLWYGLAGLHIRGCCALRNWLKIGV